MKPSYLRLKMTHDLVDALLDGFHSIDNESPAELMEPLLEKTQKERLSFLEGVLFSCQLNLECVLQGPLTHSEMTFASFLEGVESGSIHHIIHILNHIKDFILDRMHTLQNTQEFVDFCLTQGQGPRTVTDPLASFLYSLFRDDIPLGRVHGVVSEALDFWRREKGNGKVRCSNGYLADYANYVAGHLHTMQALSQEKGDAPNEPDSRKQDGPQQDPSNPPPLGEGAL